MKNTFKLLIDRLQCVKIQSNSYSKIRKLQINKKRQIHRSIPVMSENLPMAMISHVSL